ncbi:hypothetical protein LN483_07120 [Xanthomonas euvesicatoria pv. euvesicatoria]|uniref:Uncharacterized protein n=2 Tax=Xanthomonas TaxID=338 RepID=Q3C067_XANE5|nr:hypothetical protein [Xanthomonas euvesicatoria]AOY69347.1 hypothetical protein BHE83_22455 [Xanthomonas euvesicatoria pv. vesicatoria str. 85-10]APO88695.1 hypothetical protein BJD11_00535 [Xanthomonas euvesicatoria]KLB38568.1 hypothetical protein XEUV206_19455 [Xanthomonas euvesicatoria]MCC8595070.1 hypothetical protein [Xanthomonas euvesicatoria pv. euvesicatoria]MCC8639304.1 hypothetical protein [Xanthomonas euvesicatoria pv. euvesicatoria]
MRLVNIQSFDAASYREFEGIMLEFAKAQGWEFSFQAQPLPLASVFNNATFGPALLVAAQVELSLRKIEVDLGLVVQEDNGAMFGRRVEFDPARSHLLTQMWRLTQTAYQVDLLPREQNRIVLDLVPAALEPYEAPALQAGQ